MIGAAAERTLQHWVFMRFRPVTIKRPGLMRVYPQTYNKGYLTNQTGHHAKLIYAHRERT